MLDYRLAKSQANGILGLSANSVAEQFQTHRSVTERLRRIHAERGCVIDLVCGANCGLDVVDARDLLSPGSGAVFYRSPSPVTFVPSYSHDVQRSVNADQVLPMWD